MSADHASAENSDWITSPQIIASAEAMRAACGHPPREARHWWQMWLDYGEEGDRWVRMAEAALTAEPSPSLIQQTFQLRALRAMSNGRGEQD